MRSRRRKRDAELNPDLDETRIYKKPATTPKPAKRKWGRFVGMVVLGVVLFLVGMGVGMYTYLMGYSRGYPRTSELPLVSESTSRMNILVVGIDGGVNGQSLTSLKTGTRSDVMLLVSIDTETKDVGVLSIPRDTRVFIPKVNDLEKAGHAHAYGGPELVVQTLEDFLDVEIHRYVRIDFEGFKKVIDILGGVDIDVPPGMDYEDPDQDLYIHLKPGPQTLYGEDALKFVRFREYVDGDIGRIRAQQQFLNALADKVLRISTVTKLPSMISEMLPYVLTDMSNEDMMYLASVGLGAKLDEVKWAILPGGAGYIGDVSYWLVDSEKAAQVIDEIIRGIDRERNSEVRVAVQNGCGVPGAADYIASILRSYGFNVVSVGNADNFDYDETKVLAPKAKQDVQTELLKSMRVAGIESKGYTSDQVPEEYDVLVIIGKDFRMPR
ncbi:MAG TPA: LCP family protein [Firmicutes bacterium]|nr:LCP family protein [Bacillota bacterium]